MEKKNPAVRFNLECVSMKYVPIDVESCAFGETFIEGVQDLIDTINRRDNDDIPLDSTGNWFKNYYYTCEDSGYYFYTKEDMDYKEHEPSTPKQKCKDCGHISDQFIQPAKVDCDALVDYQGEFQWWKSENFENPEFQKGTFMCEACYSEDLEDYEEESNEPKCRYCGSDDLFFGMDKKTLYCGDCSSKQE
jgi:hypothetical protein